MCGGGIFNLKCALIEIVILNLNLIYSYKSELFRKTFQTSSWYDYKITFWICVCVLWFLKGYLVVKKHMLNVGIKTSVTQNIL